MKGVEVEEDAIEVAGELEICSGVRSVDDDRGCKIGEHGGGEVRSRARESRQPHARDEKSVFFLLDCMFGGC